MLRRFAAWLADYAGVTPTVEQARLKAGNDAVERGARWEMFYREEGGIGDMIALLRLEAFEAAAELDPKETDKIYYWATADRNLRKLDQRIQQIVASGKVEAANVLTLERINSAKIKR